MWVLQTRPHGLHLAPEQSLFLSRLNLEPISFIRSLPGHLFSPNPTDLQSTQEIKSAIQATLTVGGFTFTVGGHTYKGGNGARRYQVTANGQILSSVQTPGPSVKREEEVGVRVEDMDDGNGNPLPTFTLRHAPPVSPGQIFAAMQQAVTFRDIAVEASSIFKPKPPYCGQ